jgi:tetratricopeptide (TPR) repeat protein
MWFLLLATVHAQVQLPSFREELVVSAWLETDQQITRACRWPEGYLGVGTPLHCIEEQLDEAIVFAERFQRQVTPDGRIRYLIGLAQRHAGRIQPAIETQRYAIKLAPERKEAWMELGELLTLERRYEQAREAFEQVTHLLPDGPGAWLPWFQLAQIDAHQRLPEPFEAHIRQALRHGFTFQAIEGQPAWQAFYADPVMQPVIRRMVSYYSKDTILKSLETHAPD